jgi:hypothetical protein
MQVQKGGGFSENSHVLAHKAGTAVVNFQQCREFSGMKGRPGYISLPPLPSRHHHQLPLCCSPNKPAHPWRPWSLAPPPPPFRPAVLAASAPGGCLWRRLSPATARSCSPAGGSEQATAGCSRCSSWLVPWFLRCFLGRVGVCGWVLSLGLPSISSSFLLRSCCSCSCFRSRDGACMCVPPHGRGLARGYLANDARRDAFFCSFVLDF